MAYAEITENTPGIITVSFNGDELSKEGFDDFLIQLEATYHAHDRAIMIFDGTNTTHLPTEYRQKMGRWMANHKTLIRESCFLQIYVINSPLMQFVLQGIFLIQKPPVSFKTLSNMADAQQLADHILKSIEGVPFDLDE